VAKGGRRKEGRISREKKGGKWVVPLIHFFTLLAKQRGEKKGGKKKGFIEGGKEGHSDLFDF